MALGEAEGGSLFPSCTQCSPLTFNYQGLGAFDLTGCLLSGCFLWVASDPTFPRLHDLWAQLSCQACTQDVHPLGLGLPTTFHTGAMGLGQVKSITLGSYVSKW